MPPPQSSRPYVRADEGASILVVEDVPNTLTFITRVLQDYGYVVRGATTAEEGLAALRDGLPDLLVLDLLLPDGHGLDVCRALRADPAGDDVPVLVITADERLESHGEAVRAGADDFLRKPILAPELQTRARSLLRLRRLRRELRADKDAILELQLRQEEMVQFVMHDLNNLLSALLARVELFQEEGTPEAWGDHRRKIGSATRSLRELVAGVLDLSLADREALRARRESVAPSDFLRHTLSEFANFGFRRRQAFDLRLEEAPDAFWIDPQLTRRAVFNLLENAQRFTPEGAAIQVGVATRDGVPCLWVADEGPGIPDADKERVFDRLFRLDHGAEHRRGRGLGLAFCRLVAELHGGAIRAEDHHPRGTRFVLTLPGSPEDPR